MTSSGDTDPRLLSLYPKNNSNDELERASNRQARQHEMSVITQQAHYKQIKLLTETLGETNKLLAQQIHESVLEKAVKAGEEAQKNRELKRQVALLGLAGAIVGGLAAATSAYLSRDPKIPEVQPATAEQRKAYEEHERAAKHEPAPTPEFNAIVDSAK